MSRASEKAQRSVSPAEGCNPSFCEGASYLAQNKRGPKSLKTRAGLGFAPKNGVRALWHRIGKN